MNRYRAINLGGRWSAKFPWGILIETGSDTASLVCHGWEKAPAVEITRRLNAAQRPAGSGGFLRWLGFGLALVVLLGSGCALAPLKGGKATSGRTGAGLQQTLAQGDNPAAVSKQDQETIRTKTYTVPAGSRLEETRVVADANGGAVTNASALVISAPMPVVEHEETRAKTELGAAQKDTAREIGAKLASLKGLVWVGVVVFLLGLATMFYPPLRAIVGSITTSAAITAGGLALIILPTMIVGNELLILGGVAAAVGLWFLAHRHGKLSGQVEAGKNMDG